METDGTYTHTHSPPNKQLLLLFCFSLPSNFVRRGNNTGVNYYEGHRWASTAGRASTGGKPGAENSKVMQHQTKESQAWDQLCCDELLFWLVWTSLALLAQGSGVSYHPNIHTSPALPSCQLRPPKLQMVLHIFHLAISTVQVLQVVLHPVKIPPPFCIPPPTT